MMHSNERLLAGVVLIIIGIEGLALRFTGNESTVGTTGFVFYKGGYSMLSLIITSMLLIVTSLGLYIVYDAVKRRNFINIDSTLRYYEISNILFMEYIILLEERQKELEQNNE